MSDQVELKDFTKKRKPVEFMLDGHKYVCFKALSVPKLQEMAKIAKEFDTDTAIVSLGAFFKLIMAAEDAQKLVDKLQTQGDDPLEIDQAVDIMHWTLEKYGLRPTQSSSDSSTGSPTDGDGTRSAAGV